MTNKEAIRWLLQIKDKYIHGGDDSFDASRREAIDRAVKALEFAESQRICCDNCTNRRIKSEATCTSPYGRCEFYES